MAVAAAEYNPRLPMTVHRDQDQVRPLYGALELGAQSIECDVHVMPSGAVLVGHDRGDEAKTLEAEYLRPLTRLFSTKRVVREFTLLIDVKTEASSSFTKIHSILTKYSDFLTSFDPKAGLQVRQLRIIISGNRDKSAIKETMPRIAFYDGRSEDITADMDPTFMPMVSDKWSKVMKSWFGCFACCRCTESPGNIRRHLVPKVDAVAHVGITFRTWAMPENEETWELLKPLSTRGFVYNTDVPHLLSRVLLA